MKTEITAEDWGDGEERIAELPAPVEQPLPAIQPETSTTDEPLPDNIRDAAAEIARLDKLQPATREDALVIRTRRERLGKRMMELQNGTPPPIITTEHLNQKKQTEENRHIARQQRLEKLAKAYPSVRALIQAANKKP